MKKLEKIAQQEQKTREKIAALQSILKEIDGARTEQENLQIIKKFRALKLSREELYSFLGGGELPPAFTEMFGGATDQPENIYSQNSRKRRNKRDNDPDTTTEDTTADHSGETTNFESEGLNNEE